LSFHERADKRASSHIHGNGSCVCRCDGRGKRV
jgi:hypothetical protein